MKHSVFERVTQDLLNELRRICFYASEQLPRGIELMEAFAPRHPKLPQVACFDMVFHHTVPRVVRLLPIPARHYRPFQRRRGAIEPRRIAAGERAIGTKMDSRTQTIADRGCARLIVQRN